MPKPGIKRFKTTSNISPALKSLFISLLLTSGVRGNTETEKSTALTSPTMPNYPNLHSYGLLQQHFSKRNSIDTPALINVGDTSGDQTHINTILLDNGNVFTTYTSANLDGLGDAVAACIIDANQNIVVSPFLVNQNTSSSQNRSKIIKLANGDVMIVWMSYLQDGSGDGVYYRVFAANGTALTDETIMNDVTSGNQDFPSIQLSNDGSYFTVAYMDDHDGNGARIYARNFNANNYQPLAASFRVDQASSGQQLYPHCVALPDNRMAIGWINQSSGGATSINMQIIDNNNTLGLANDLVVSDNASDIAQSDLYGTLVNDENANMRLLWTWTSYNQTETSNNVLARLMNVDGSIDSNEPPYQVNTISQGNQYQATSIQLDGQNGNVFQVFTCDQNGSDDICAIYRGLGNNSTVYEPEFVVIGGTLSQNTPYAIAQSIYGADVFWQNNNPAQDLSGYGLYGASFAILPHVNTTPLNYTENQALDLSSLTLASDLPDNNTLLSLRLSDPLAGTISTPINVNTANVTTGTGSWQAQGNVDGINELVSGLVFTPADNYNNNVTLNISAENYAGSFNQTISLIGTPVDQPALISLNQLTIQQGATVTLTNTDNLAIEDVDTPLNQITIIANAVEHGSFQYSNQPGVTIYSFNVMELAAGIVQFKHDGSKHSPNYQLIANDGNKNSTASYPAVSFTLKQNNKTHSNTNTIIGAVLGTVGGLLATGAALFGVYQYRKSQQRAAERAQNILSLTLYSKQFKQKPKLN
ncbi:MAG: hypothetical protein HWD59_02765 [Coxiellaceae bacterium]|nr:MAG: hypothetical protein HWD59_02765 [Coxiellaceae bacterium]